MPLKYFLVGDDAYPANEQMVTPFPGSQEYRSREDNFNFYQSSTRIRIEMAFGRLVQRFGILWRPLGCSLDFVAPVVFTCMILHNLCFANESSVIRHVSSLYLKKGVAIIPDGVGGSPALHEQDDCWELEDAGNRAAAARSRMLAKKVLARRNLLADHVFNLGLQRPERSARQ